MIGEYFRRVRGGEMLGVDAYCREFPEYAAELHRELGNQAGTIVYDEHDEEATRPTPSAPGETITFDGTPADSQVIDLAKEADFRVSQVAHHLEEAGRPRRFGEYELLEVIGRGGMGVVCKARQRSIDRIVALKMIRDGQLASAGDIERFYIEAHAAGSLTHPNIVAVHEAGVIEGHPFYTMEFIEGEDLGRRIKRNAVQAEEIAPLMITVAKAVHYAHTKDILHRDLKPANVLIDEQGHPLVTDFGLARQVGKSSKLTASGAPMGTPGYMPPEQAAGRIEEFGPTVDIYSLGAVLYEMLTGRPPFEADSLADIVMKVLHKEPEPPHTINPSADRDLETICLKCLQKDPKLRYQSALELADDLRRAHEGKPIQAQPASLPVKVWHWLRDVPLIAALVHRRVVHPTPLHKLAQWSFLVSVGLVLGAVVAWQLYTPGMPGEVRILSGHPEGKYFAVATDLARTISAQASLPSMAVATAGSVENHERLLAGEAELAAIQAESLISNRLAVVAPLYYEFVLIVVRRSSVEEKQIADIADLARCSVALGPPGSGMRQGALRVLASLNIDGRSLPGNEQNFLALLTEPSLDAAIVITGLENPGARRLLATGDFQLLPIASAERVAMRIPSFHAGHIFGDQLPSEAARNVDEQGLATLFTPAYLVSRRDAPDALVRATLAALYDGGDLVARHNLLPLADAASWRAIPRHPAAEVFFEERVGEP